MPCGRLVARPIVTRAKRQETEVHPQELMKRETTNNATPNLNSESDLIPLEHKFNSRITKCGDKKEIFWSRESHDSSQTKYLCKERIFTLVLLSGINP